MAHESFEDADVAAVLNQFFVPVKVDREERPDVDRLYMAFVQASTGSGGWPMSVWLTPEGQPFFGGTYFPPQDRYGRPGFVTVLERIAELWATERENLVMRATEVVEELRRANTAGAATEGGAVPGVATLEAGAASFERAFDPAEGGFGGAPKFPRPSVFNFLFTRAVVAGPGGAGILHAALHTLRKMDAGGMHDQVGGGFHRYSVDGFWHVPHFEKMLYDQGQLVCSYLDAWQVSGDEAFLAPVRDTLDYVLRDLTHDEGGFFSAEDADSLLEFGGTAHAEGAFYVWTVTELEAVLLPEELRLVTRHWGVEPGGNAPDGADPHGEFTGKNILIRRESLAASAEAVGIEPDAAGKVLESVRKKLFAAREKRPRPHLDDKVLTAWNGLMISAFARAGALLGDERYAAAARRAVAFVLRELAKGDRLFRTWRDGKRAEIAGFAEDYAFFVQGLLDLYEAEFDPEVLQTAIRLQSVLDAEFSDTEGGGYFTGAADDPLVPVRTKEDYDGAEPSASAVGARNLLRLARMLHDDTLAEKAARIFRAFAPVISRMPTAVPQMLVALEWYHSPPRQAVIVGPRDHAETRALAARVRAEFSPLFVVLHVDPDAREGNPVARSEAVAAMDRVDGRSALYVCENFVCREPVTLP